MKRSFTLLLPLLLVFLNTMACKQDDINAQDSTSTVNNPNEIMNNRLKIRVGSSTFTATLLNNASVAAFKKQLPLKLAMTELNGNEKYAQLPIALPTNAANPGTIQTGDLLLYGSNTLVIFYETFRTSYTYTKLGRIDNPAGLAAALGAGNVTVTFEVE